MNRIKKFDDFYPINEEISFDDIKARVSDFVTRVKNIDSKTRKTLIRSFLVSLLLISPISNVLELVSNIGGGIGSETTEVLNNILDDRGFGKATEMKLSDSGWDFIKGHEGYSAKAYMLGDGMITIGWGHAEPASKSTFKKGEVISRDKAHDLLKIDLKTAADGVRRIFRDWESKDINVPITQDMFDALVSIAFNTGVSSLRNSDLIQDLKKKDYESAGKKIKLFRVSKKYPGLKIRRSEESKKFLSFKK
jgi:lysozyme